MRAGWWHEKNALAARHLDVNNEKLWPSEFLPIQHEFNVDSTTIIINTNKRFVQQHIANGHTATDRTHFRYGMCVRVCVCESIGCQRRNHNVRKNDHAVPLASAHSTVTGSLIQNLFFEFIEVLMSRSCAVVDSQDIFMNWLAARCGAHMKKKN